MRGSSRVLATLSIVCSLVALSTPGEALVDHMERDSWLPFTHFHLGDRAFAGYSETFAKSGRRSYHVEISGWVVRDFGSAYGYALYAIRGAPVTELRVSLLFDRIEDLSPSPRDAFAAGVGLELLDADHRSLGSYRYIAAFRASQNAGRCAPTTADVVLAPPGSLGSWVDLGRNPAADFPAAPWSSAAFMKVSVGFLCAAGLTGARYSLYFDDFLLDTGAGDGDGDGLADLEEEARIYVTRVRSGRTPLSIPPMETTAIEIAAPPAAGLLASAAAELEIAHARPDDLSIEFQAQTGDGTWLLWDPGIRARGAAILAPSDGAAVRGTVAIAGKTSWPDPLVDVFVDAVPIATSEGDSTGRFEIPWDSDAWPEGLHGLHVVGRSFEGDELLSSVSREVRVLVDRTPPDLAIVRPADGETLGGLALVEAGAFDGDRLAAVELWVDGFLVETRYAEPYAFAYETADLGNGAHAFEVRARDRAGNEAVDSLSVFVNNKESAPPPPCYPVCMPEGPASDGNLEPLSLRDDGRIVPLASGDIAELSEAFEIPWRAGVARTATGVALVLDLIRPRSLPEVDGLAGTDIVAADLAGVREWRIVVRDHGRGDSGTLQSASIRLAYRSSPAQADTDADGLPDGMERGDVGTSPVLADVDADLLLDGEEIEERIIPFAIDGRTYERTIRTDPFDFDTDDDGLPDGLELLPGEGRNPSDPLDSDTDREGVPDGAERFVHGSDPTLSDTDEDSLSDYDEVTPRELALEIDGMGVVRSIVTSPVTNDTDGDGLRDDEEWSGLDVYGSLTDPTDPDTDRDGLSDLDEVVGLNRRPTSPVTSDTDADGVGDGLDLSPTERWDFPWKPTFEPGIIRFTQRFKALALHAVFAGIWTYDILDNECVFLSDHTADATRSSDESVANVVGTVNGVFAEGGETNFTALTATHLGQESFGAATISYGACDALAPRQYRFEYIHDSHRYDIDFMNAAEVAIRDDDGEPLYHASVDIPIRLSKPQAVILQLSIRAEADRGGQDEEGTTVVPAIVYTLYRGSEFLSTFPFYRNLAVGAALDEHAYEFHLRIPEDVAREENTLLVGEVPMATLVVMPVWLTSAGSTVTRAALNTTDVTVSAAITRVQESAELIVAQLDTDMVALEAALPASAEGLSLGRQEFGDFLVYVYRIGEPFDSGIVEEVDAVYFVGDSPEEIAAFQQSVVLSPREEWVRESEDGFGLFIDVFKIIRRGISLTSQVTAAIVVPFFAVPGTTEQMTFGRSAFVITKLTNIETGEPYYVIGATAVQTVKVRVPHPEIPDVMLTEVRTIEVEVRSEIVDDLDDSRLLTGVRYSHLRLAMRGAAVGATLVIFGSQAVIAFNDGEVVKGTVYALAGATGTFGIVKSDVVLAERLFAGRTQGVGLRVRLGAVAAVAVTGILASFELYLASQTDNPIQRLSHYESAGAVFVDGIIAAVPLYGAAAMLGWQLGLVVAVGAESLLGIVPDPLAVRIVSTPGSVIVFLFEYVFATEIPADVAQDALVQLLNFLADMVRFNNSMSPPSPSLVLVP